MARVDCTPNLMVDTMRTPSLAPSRRSGGTVSSHSHIDRWHEASETIIILDWDDTLCPTTCIWSDPRLAWDKPAPCFQKGGEFLPACPPAASKYTPPQEPAAEPVAEFEPSIVMRSEADPRADRQSACTSRSGAGFKDGGRPVKFMTMLEQFQMFARNVAALLRLAASLGQVCIVTLGKEGWVELSIRNFMPGLEGLLEELGVEVVYARNALPPKLIKLAEEENQDVFQALKTRAIWKVVNRFYRNSRSWKNIIGIGDSEVELFALQDVVMCHEQYDRHGKSKECRCKTVKLLQEPDHEQMTVQVQILLAWLSSIVHHNGDLSLDFEELSEPPPTP